MARKYMQYFYAALYTSLTADSDIVAAVSHTSSDIRILRQYPDRVSKYPCLVFLDDQTVPMIPSAQTYSKRTAVNFNCIAKDDLTAINIADLLEDKFHLRDTPQYQQYWSITDSKVTNNMTMFIRREEPQYYDENDYWNIVVVGEFFWYLKTSL